MTDPQFAAGTLVVVLLVGGVWACLLLVWSRRPVLPVARTLLACEAGMLVLWVLLMAVAL